MKAPTKNNRVWFIFVAISILLSSILFGTYKRTLSSTLGEMEQKSETARLFCKALDIVLSDPNHCQKEYRDYLEEIK